MSILKSITGKNPLNVKNGADLWEGSVGSDEKGHAIFIHESYCFRAGCRILSVYQNEHKCHTLNEIFERWAPVTDGNNPVAYAKFVAQKMGIHQDEPILLFHADGAIASEAHLEDMLNAMTEMEVCTGYQVPLEVVNSGMALYVKTWG